MPFLFSHDILICEDIMKNLFLILISIFLTAGIVYAKSEQTKMPSINFNGTNFTLFYSAKSPKTGGFINEYYKTNQTYASWTELIGVHHYPSSFYPIEHAKEFAEYLNSNGVVTSIEIDDENNSALLYFVVADKHKLPIIIEFNVFKYVKNSVCGTTGVQFAKRYRLNSPLEMEKAQKSIVKNGLKYIKKISKLKIPEVVALDIDNGKYILKEGCLNNLEDLD